jgi:RNA polymerase sigma factor (sigma-70 family)
LDVETNPSIFLRLNRTDTAVRELAWKEFHDLYARIIGSFAHRLGARADEVDDIVQEVLLGFFAKAPTFVYDVSKGRFRAYLKTCTCNILARWAQRDARFRPESLEQIDPDSLQIDQVWNDVWEQQQIRLAVEQLRGEMGETKAFRAFEQYVILDRPAGEVAEKLDMHLDSVYRAREQITERLRNIVSGMEDG